MLHTLFFSRSFVAIALLALLSAPAHALLEPQPLATDGRIKTVRYSFNDIFKFTGHYGYQSVIEFGPTEEIMTVSIGDTISWQIKPSGSRLFIKPVEQDAMTNMTVITNQHTYYFELHADEVNSVDNQALVFVMRFLYDAEQPMLVTRGQDDLPDLSDSDVRDSMNFNYSIVGPERISPIRIYDDGEFTYFEFEDLNAELPAVYVPDALGNESVINYRMEGEDTMVIERVETAFTFRSGPYVLCVFNENARMDPIPEPEEVPFWKQVF